MAYTAELALFLLLIIPLVAAALIPLAAKNANLREGITLVAGVALLANVIGLISMVSGGARPELHLGTFAGNFDVKLKLEPLGATFAAIASSLWIVNSLFAIGYMRGNKEKNQTRFYTFVAIAIFGAMGIAASANLITLFIFYEALTISTFPLVTHKGDAKAKRGGTIYALILMGTSLALFLPGNYRNAGYCGHNRFYGWRCFPRRDVNAGGLGALIPLCLWYRQGRFDARSSVVTQCNGGSNAGVCFAACRGGCESGRVFNFENRRLYLRPVYHGGNVYEYNLILGRGDFDCCGVDHCA